MESAGNAMALYLETAFHHSSFLFSRRKVNALSTPAVAKKIPPRTRILRAGIYRKKRENPETCNDVIAVDGNPRRTAGATELLTFGKAGENVQNACWRAV